MAAGKSSSNPRSVADATRFTANTPHANTKPTTPSSSSSPSPSKPNAGASSSQTLPRRGALGSIPQETLDERVRRLRAAHLAAKQHSVSRMDQIIGGSRRFFDAAHKFTVMGLIGFSGIALLVTVYATADMMMYNRKRRSEFFSLQKQLKEDSLEAARLAYMTGTASEEQIALVEDATARAKEAGLTLPSILSVPHAMGERENSTSTAVMTEDAHEAEPETQQQKKKKGGITGWLFGGLRKEDVAAQTETLSSSDEKWTSTTSTTTTADLRDKAKTAFDQERENQRKGGPLDQVGINATTTTEEKKKGWLW